MHNKYFSLFRLSCTLSVRNYKALIGLSIFLVTCLVIFAHLWKVVAAKTGAVNFAPNLLLWYIAFNEWILVSVPDPQDGMEEDFRTGKLSYQLLRPMSYLGAIFVEALGHLCVNLTILGVVTFVFTWFQAGSLPFGGVGFAVSALCGLLAGILAIVFKMIIGLSAFWLHEADPVSWVWEKLLFMFGGLMLPLSVYPVWIQTLSSWTPFPAILGGRSALVFDMSFSGLLWTYLIWLVIAVICLRWLYQRACRIVHIEGG